MLHRQPGKFGPPTVVSMKSTSLLHCDALGPWLCLSISEDNAGHMCHGPYEATPA